LKAKALTAASPVGTSTDGISIGADLVDTISYPYWFNGILDDLELYNRVLSDSEIERYGALPSPISDPSALLAHDSSILFIPGSSTLSVQKNIAQQQSVKIFPNPVKSALNIKMGRQLNELTSAEIINQLGQVVKRSEIVSQQQQIPVDDLPSGVYFIHIQDNAGTITEKFVKE